jgi:hypothetical protein
MIAEIGYGIGRAYRPHLNHLALQHQLHLAGRLLLMAMRQLKTTQSQYTESQPNHIAMSRGDGAAHVLVPEYTYAPQNAVVAEA